ncbi:MAG: hypothetical protein RTV31_09165 [Candidatus Thorarchaeota archaeon]
MGEKLHTPLMLRTGFFYSYRHTLIVWASLLAAIYLVNLTLGFEEIIFTILSDAIFTLVILSGAGAMKKVVSSYHEMFGIFDSDILTQLSTFNGFKIDEKIEPHKTRDLFTTTDSYNDFRQKTSRILFSKIEIWILTLVTLTCFGFILITFATPGSWSVYGEYVPFWTLLRQILGVVIFFPLVVIYAVAGLIFIFGYFRIVHLLKESRENFLVFEHIRFMKNEAEKTRAGVSYYKFYNDIAIIGRQIYEVTFQAVVTLVVGLLWYVNFPLHPAINSWIMSAIVIPIAFIIFILPQLHLHSLLAMVKEFELQYLENEHDSLKVQFLSILGTSKSSGDTRKHLDPFERNSICNEISTLKDLIYDTRAAPTWSFRMPTTLKLLGTSILPFLATIFQQIILPALIP